MSNLYAGGLANDGSAPEIDNIWIGGATVCAWVYLLSYGGSSFGRICDKDNALGGQGWAFYGWGGGQNSLRFHVGWSLSSMGSIGPVNSLLLNQWYHVGAVYDGSNVANVGQLYQDGLPLATTQLSPAFGTIIDDSAQLYTIGNMLATTRAFDGCIADLRLYNRILSAPEFATVYAARGRDHIVEGLLRRHVQSPLVPGLGTALVPDYSRYTSVAATTVSVSAAVDELTIRG